MTYKFMMDGHFNRDENKTHAPSLNLHPQASPRNQRLPRVCTSGQIEGDLCTIQFSWV